MSIIIWDERLSVGIGEIDRQHQELAELVNRLSEAVSNHEEREVLRQLLSNLINSTVIHFQTEELYMETGKFPGYEAHKQEHDELLVKVNDLKSRFDSGQVSITPDIAVFLRNWLKGHIIGADMQYAVYLAGSSQSIGLVGVAP